MLQFDRLKAILATKPVKMIIPKPEQDKRVYIFFTLTNLVVVSKSRYKDVSKGYYFHDNVTGEFLHANGRNDTYGNADRLLVAEYEQIKQILQD